MNTKQLSIEISESLFKQLEHFYKITEESIENLVISMISVNILLTKRDTEILKEKLDNISLDSTITWYSST